MSFIMSESLVSSVAVYMILRKLMTNFSDWDAHKLGIIDKDGKKLKHPITGKEREAWDILTRFCWNLKKMIEKYAGKSKFASYFSAAWLLKDSASWYPVLSTHIYSNRGKLDENLLADLTCAKQYAIFKAMKELPQLAEGEDIADNMEFLYNKYLQTVENVVQSLQLESALFEDGEAAPASAPAPTVQGDIAKSDNLLFTPKRRLKKFKSKKKKEIK